MLCNLTWGEKTRQRIEKKAKNQFEQIRYISQKDFILQMLVYTSYL